MYMEMIFGSLAGFLGGGAAVFFGRRHLSAPAQVRRGPV